MNGVRRTLESVNCDGRRGLLLACLCLLLLLPSAAGDAGRRLLRYDRIALAHGEWWRLLTAHVVHLGLRHALLNALGLALLWALFVRDYSPRSWTLIVLGALVGIDAGLWLADSTVHWYVGSSGVLQGVMAAGALAKARRREWDGVALGVLLAGKLAYEHWRGPLPFAGTAAVVVDGHLYGVLGALAVAAFLRPRPAPL
ncbi:MAG: rhombosortase [Gammaproteobacteria bacterium]|nr:rhombosortase [Gammaproteobacteria bacterium]